MAEKSFHLLSSKLFQETSLHIAVRQQDLETVRMLLDQGVDTNIKDKNGVNKTSLLMVD